MRSIPRRSARCPTPQTAVQLGLRARLASQGITGLSYLELDFVDPARYPALDVPWKPKADIHPVDAEHVLSGAGRGAAGAGEAEPGGHRHAGHAVDRIAERSARANLASGDVHQTLAEASALLRTTGEAVQAADLPGLSADI